MDALADGCHPALASVSPQRFADQSGADGNRRLLVSPDRARENRSKRRATLAISAEIYLYNKALDIATVLASQGGHVAPLVCGRLIASDRSAALAQLASTAGCGAGEQGSKPQRAGVVFGDAVF